LQDHDISKLGVAAGAANAATKCAQALDGSVTRESRQRPQLTPSGFVGLLPKAARRIDRAAVADDSVEALSRGPKFGVEAQDEERLSLGTG